MTKKVGLIIILGLSSFLAPAQFKNIRLDESASAGVSHPAIAVNLRDRKNIVAAWSPNIIYYTVDEGQTWEKSAVPGDAIGDPVLISDNKGTFYVLHVSGPAGDDTSKSMDQIVCHISKDGGKTWEEGSSLGLNLPKDQNHPAAALDTKGNLFVTWTQFDKYGSADSTCQSRIMISSSSSGKKWSKPLELSQQPGSCMDDAYSVAGGMAAVAPDGKIFVCWANANKIYLDRSFQGGLWLQNDIPVTDQKGGWDFQIPGHEGSNGIPVLMVDQTKGTYQGCIYLVWADQRSGGKDTDVWFIRSNNHGDNWSSPMKMGSDKNGRHQYLPWMTVDQVTGFIYVVYYDRSEYDDNQTDVFLSYSNDSGANFKSVKISEAPFTPVNENFTADHINIAAHDGIITPVWSRFENGKASIWTAVIRQDELIPPVAPAGKGKKKK